MEIGAGYRHPSWPATSARPELYYTPAPDDVEHREEKLWFKRAIRIKRIQPQNSKQSVRDLLKLSLGQRDR